MVEFGEKIKRAREEKGMTQQTLAEQLFVTRQAVSRWECGARYPDLLTAKKLSEILDVSLDELLSGEEMKRCVEKNPIIESPVIGRVQSALYAFAGSAYLLLGIFSFRFLIPDLAGADPKIMGYRISYLLGYVLMAALLFCGLILSVLGKLTPKKTGIISASYFGVEIASNLFWFIQVQTPFMWSNVIQSIIFAVCAAMIVRYYFQIGKLSPVPVYCVAVFCFVRSVIIYAQMLKFVNDFAFVVQTVWLLAMTGYTGLMAYQAHALEKKWNFGKLSDCK